MSNKLSGFKEPIYRDSKLSDDDVLNIFAIASFALRDAEIFDYVANKLDLDDKEVQNLRNKI